ncbi:MAG: FHS family L-fucose permease-like MFS transporter [Paraglaciecola sp.]|uniref:type IX secretion system membrane protein PorP/SprF n=1 Tax=Polaribacter sp. TaxID=1920175 RepID=UPI003AE094D1
MITSSLFADVIHNPAQYATKKTFDLFHTSRWIGFTGAPGTTLLTAKINTENNKVSFGGVFRDDIIGAQSQTEISGFYSYSFKAVENLFIDMGISGLGCLLFFPGAEFKMYGFFLGALFILGLGFTMLQIAANPYVAILGRPETASSRLNMSQAFNSLGTTIAPFLGGYLMYEYFFSHGSSGGEAVKIPYIIFGLIFFVGAVVFKFVKLPKFVNEDEVVKGAGALKFKNLSYGTLAIFMYVGGEVAFGSFLINFIGLESIMGLEEVIAKNFLAYYWGGTMIGRFSGALSLSAIEKTKKYALRIFLGRKAQFFVFKK